MQNAFDDFRVALFSGDYASAERIAYRELSLLGQSPEWLNELGLLCVSQGRLSEALEYFDKAVILRPTFVEAMLNGVVVLSDLGFYDEACARFDGLAAMRSQAAEPGSAAATENPQGDLPVAELDVKRQIASFYAEIARRHQASGQLDEAEQAIRHAIALFPHVKHYLLLAEFCLEKNDVSQALLELENARRVDPKCAEVQVIAAQIYMIRNRRDEAFEALARAELLEDRSRTGEVLRRTFQSQTTI